MKKALILLGCPESPSQTPMAIYASQKLAKMDYDVTVASTPSASKLLEVSDPDEYYIKNKVDIESTLDSLKEGSYDLLIGFAHKDAAVSYFVTFYHILQCESIALVFEKDLELLEEFENIVKDNTDAKIVSVRAFHNPTPLRVKFDRVLESL
ncbi:MAG: DUF1890 domain-containing protein [Methanobrevibacter sp.]|nr:DUF1890 domain-containing protein [Methanobrevibacter sp.]